MKITVLGAGRWASTIALCLDRKGYDVMVWEKMWDKVETNPLFLTGSNKYVTLSKNVKFTHDLEEAFAHSDLFVMSILSQQVENFMQEIKKVKGYSHKKYVLAMKGVQATTGRRLSEILIDNGVDRENIAVWVGPGQPPLIADKQPTNMVISAYNRVLAQQLVENLTTKGILDLSLSEDIIGTEIGAAAKNVIGIAAGILDGHNFEQKKGPLISAAIKEMGLFIKAMGGEQETASGLAFAGDFQATLFYHGNNWSYGDLIVKRNTLNAEDLADVINVKSVEGIMTAKALILLEEMYNKKVTNNKQLKMPITHAVDDICSGKVPLDKAGYYMSDKITEALEL